MTQTKLSKRDAALLIRRAIGDGWKRNISVMSDSTGVWSVQVSMTKTIYFGNGYINLSSHIIVSFRKSTKRGWVVSVAVPNGSKTFRGGWNANYALRTMAETCARQNERDAQKDLVAA